MKPRWGSTPSPVERASLMVDGLLMPHRIRHCVECPKCLTQYLVGFSPYSNGSYLVPSVVGSSEEYTLYCSCRKPYAVSEIPWIGESIKRLMPPAFIFAVGCLNSSAR